MDSPLQVLTPLTTLREEACCLHPEYPPTLSLGSASAPRHSRYSIVAAGAALQSDVIGSSHALHPPCISDQRKIVTVPCVFPRAGNWSEVSYLILHIHAGVVLHQVHDRSEVAATCSVDRRGVATLTCKQRNCEFKPNTRYRTDRTRVLAFTSAPWSTKHLIISKAACDCLHCAAHINAVQPYCAARAQST